MPSCAGLVCLRRGAWRLGLPLPRLVVGYTALSMLAGQEASRQAVSTAERSLPMLGQTSDPYLRLLTEWHAKREVVNAYHRALRFLPGTSADTPQRRRELTEKLVAALLAVRQVSEQLRRYEDERTRAGSR
jgi:hypothetical protein